jgi:quercetin dioxygenase-like cupin family protein
MELNADFSQRVLIHADSVPWTPSPTAGVDRRMLDRIGDEVARATSIVRYAPGGAFPPHTHGGGEEFIVLEGVFQDEHGDYPAGTYVRNPPTSRHRPGSAPGCTIFVKLWQFDPADRMQVRVDVNTPLPIRPSERPGVSVVPLFLNDRETVQIETWDPGAIVRMDAPDGAELLVLGGGCEEWGEAMRAWSWLRVPAGGGIDAVAGPEGAQVWLKTGGLQAKAPI